MRQCSIFVTHLKNEYIEVEFNKARCFCYFRCLSNPYSCTITSLIFRTLGIRAQVSSGASFLAYRSVRNISRAHISVRKFPRAHLSGSRRKYRYESSVFSTIAHSASSSQCFYLTLVLILLDIYHKTLFRVAMIRLPNSVLLPKWCFAHMSQSTLAMDDSRMRRSIDILGSCSILYP